MPAIIANHPAPFHMHPVSTKKAWNKLVTLKQVDHSLVRREIAQSWERCLTSNLNPYRCDKCAPAHDLGEKTEDNQILLRAAPMHMQRLYEALPGTGFIIMLLASDGIILSISGDDKMRDHAESLLVCPGVHNTESVIGTTAPAISFIERRPARVLLSEHFIQSYHDWCCSSAPIFDRFGNVLGVLNAANRNFEGHPLNVLGIVRMAAASIEAEFQYVKLHREHTTTSLYLRAVEEASSQALVLFDKEDTLIHANKNARALIGPDWAQYLGSSADAVFSGFPSVKKELLFGKQRADLAFELRRRRIPIIAHLNLMRGDDNEAHGIICSLEKKLDAKADSKMSGAELQYSFKDFICCSPKLERILAQARQIAPIDHTVLIEGESGTGKEILAQSIHGASPRRDGPFVAVNCAALPYELIQSELFGYESGSFTGANKNGKAGKFEYAQGGTLFLDEIGDMSLEAQANLLRVLQEKRVVRIGGSRPKHLDVRIIAATNKDLLSESDRGNFRRDLYYRLAVIHLHIPPLRERPEDIWPLVEHLAKKNLSNSINCTERLSFSQKAKSAIQEYRWPGNVRELENMVILLLNKIAGNTVQLSDLPPHMRQNTLQSDAVDDLQTVERETIQSALIKCGGNMSMTAKLLGISRATLYNKINKYRLQNRTE